MIKSAIIELFGGIIPRIGTTGFKSLLGADEKQGFRVTKTQKPCFLSVSSHY